MSASLEDYQFAIDFCRKQFRNWYENDLLNYQQFQQILRHYENESSQLTESLDSARLLPEARLCPPHLKDVERRSRAHEYLSQDLRFFQSQQYLPETTTQAFLKKVSVSYSDLRKQLDQKTPAAKPQESLPKLSLVERMLDPKSLHALMMSGGGLLVIGLVIWLWSIGVFENSLVVAVCLGTANFAMIGGGAALARFTRYLTAGRSIALLGCLIMPLNLWFYDAQGLITLAHGGHLWIPALVCCLIYAVVARILKDALFVYTLVGGIAMTGLLFLADQQVGRFWEIISPATLLVVLGMICVHLERLFDDTAEIFKRSTFGKAFFRSGHIVMAAGLAVLFGGRVVGLLFDPIFAPLGWFPIPDVAALRHVQFIALMLTCGATYTYLYSHFIVKRAGRFIYAALLTLIWTEIILLDLLAIPVTEQALLLVIAFTALLTSATGLISTRLRKDEDGQMIAQQPSSIIRIAGGSLTMIAVIMGSLEFLRWTMGSVFAQVAFQFDWIAVLTMAITAMSSILMSVTLSRTNRNSSGEFYLDVTAVPLMIALLSGLHLAGLAWVYVLPIVAAVIGIGLLMTRCQTDSNMSKAGLRVLEVSAALLMTVGVGNWIGHFEYIPSEFYATCFRVLFAAEMAVIFGSFAVVSKRGVYVVLSAVSAWAAVWKLLVVLGFIIYAPMLAASLIGLMAVFFSLQLKQKSRLLAVSLRDSGLAAITIGGLAGMLLTVNRVIGGDAQWALLGLMAGQAVAAFLASSLVKANGKSRGLIVIGILHLLTGFLVINDLSILTFFQRMEIFSIAAGILMLVAGHLGWHRETDEDNDGLVSLNLVLGSLLAAGPLLLGLLSQRFMGDAPAWGWIMFHEIGTLTIGLTLLGAGILCRIRSTTLAGMSSLVVYLISLIALIHVPNQLQTVSVYMMVGGATFFGVAVMLSVYRDRLLMVPDRIRNGEGVFSVLKWR